MEPFNIVKVFSATKAADREALGDKITTWLRAHPEYRIVNTVVSQSSDASFHCLSFVFFFWQGPTTT
jgi:hypothetical protein